MTNKTGLLSRLNPETIEAISSEVMQDVKPPAVDQNPKQPAFIYIVESKKGNFPAIDLYKFRQLLTNFGFRKIDRGNECDYLQVQGGVVEQVTRAKIKHTVELYMQAEMQLPDKAEENKFTREYFISFVMKRSSSLFGRDLLEYLRDLEKPFLRDDNSSIRFYFRNGFAKVTKGEPTPAFLPYSELNGYVWKNQVLPFDFDQSHQSHQSQTSEFAKFISNVSNNDKAREQTLKSAIGYLLSTHKDPQQAKAVVLVDEEIPQYEGQANGGTGKSLILTAIGKCRKVAFENGRTWKADDKFAFQKVDLDTNVFVLDDTRKRFPFTSLYSVITNGFQIEQKGKQAFTIPFEESPKIAVTSNFSIQVNGTSDTRRVFEVEIAPFYSDRLRQGIKNPVASQHGKAFFEEGWNRADWMKFYAFMFECAAYFLNNGLQGMQTINADTRRLVDKTSYEFLEWMEETVELGKEYNKKGLYGEFKDQSETAPRRQRTFTGWLSDYAKSTGLKMQERRSSGNSYVSFISISA